VELQGGIAQGLFGVRQRLVSTHTETVSPGKGVHGKRSDREKSDSACVYFLA
jgi:hypothetical protein